MAASRTTSPFASGCHPTHPLFTFSYNAHNYFTFRYRHLAYISQDESSLRCLPPRRPRFDLARDARPRHRTRPVASLVRQVDQGTGRAQVDEGSQIASPRRRRTPVEGMYYLVLPCAAILQCCFTVLPACALPGFSPICFPSASKRKPISILKSTKAPAAPKTPKSTKAPKP